MADTLKPDTNLLRAQALCGNPAALDLLLALREDAVTQRLCESIRRELDAWDAIRRPQPSPFATMTDDEARNWHIRRDERNGRHTP